MNGLIVWSAILIPSAIVGLACGYLLKGKWGLIIAAAIPWLGLLAALLYGEYYLPYRGGGASMWPIAQLFGGSIAATTGAFVCLLSRQYLFKKNKNSNKAIQPIAKIRLICSFRLQTVTS